MGSNDDVARARKALEAVIGTHVPAFLRLSLNDALTWDEASRTGGATSSICTPGELSRPGNEGLQQVMVTVEAVAAANPGLSLADTIQLGGAVAVEAMGGPAIPFHAGRLDEHVPSPVDRLPTYDTCSLKGRDSLLEAFHRMGLTVRQGVALCGAHPFGRFWSTTKTWEKLWPSMESLNNSDAQGGSPRAASKPNPIQAFDVEIYRDILEGRDPLCKFLLHDPRAVSAMEMFLEHPGLWLADYARAFTRISEAPMTQSRLSWGSVGLCSAALGGGVLLSLTLLGLLCRRWSRALA